MSTSVLLEELIQGLTRCKPTSLSIGDDTVTFEAGPFRFVLGSNLLVAVSRGTVRLAKNGDEITMSYQLRFNELVLGGAFVSFVLAYNLPLPWVLHLAVFVGFWLVFVGGNYVPSVWRFRRFLEKTLKGVTNKAASIATATVEQ